MHGIKFDSTMEATLNDLADRMADTAVAHTKQHFNEIRVTPDELNGALNTFRNLIA